MAWFRRSKQKILSTERRSVSEDLWRKCPSCSEYVYNRELENAQYVCPTCSHHFPIRCRKYIDMLLDGPESITELNPDLTSVDALDFKARKNYKDQLVAARKKTGLSEAVVTVSATIDGYPLVLAVMDFSFIGGSMGSAVGEKISRAIDYAREHRYALAIISSSGGARMQEGALSLMQMAKSSD